MGERLLSLLESILGKSKKTSGDNYSFYSPFVDHYKRKLEINIRLEQSSHSLKSFVYPNKLGMNTIQSSVRSTDTQVSMKLAKL